MKDIKKIANDLHLIAVYCERLSRTLSDPHKLAELFMSHADDTMKALVAKVQALEAQAVQQQQANADLTVDAATLAQADALLAQQAAPQPTGTPTPADTTGGAAQPTQPVATQPLTPEQSGQPVQPPAPQQ